MFSRVFSMALACILGGQQALAQGQTGASALTEQDFLAEMPVVLSVSRLAQRLDEVPGAMTILDREFIRMTGARDVVDVLRFVPGFHTTTSFETDAPMAYYHGRNDDWANRIQVLVDGRSVYSAHLQGSVGLGLQTLALEDIERIEVLRGSNSATYGARAFLGVINIVSRNVEDTKKQTAHVNGGENGVADIGASIGGALGRGGFRLSVDSRGDDGLRKVFADPTKNGAQGGNRVSRVNFSSQVPLEAESELTLRGGALEVAAYRGTKYFGSPITADESGNWERLRFNSAAFFQADWLLPIQQEEDIRLSFSHTQMRARDGFPYLITDAGAGEYVFRGITIGFSGDEVNDTISGQHTFRVQPGLRLVWGGELRNEQITSRDAFDSDDVKTSGFLRLFAHAEWRFAPSALLNAGALWEQSSISGSNVAPRVMVNWYPLEGHTVRGGVSSAFRTPSFYEKNARVVYYSLVSPGTTYQTVKPNPELKPEWVVARELGYRWDSSARHTSLDVRLFEEQVTDGISFNNQQYVNTDATLNRGFEVQADWQLGHRQKIVLTHSRTDISVLAASAVFRSENAAPKSTTGFVYIKSFDGGWNTSVMFSEVRNVALMAPSALTPDAKNTVDTITRTDWRLGRDFKVGKQNVEAAFVIQNLNAPYRDGDRKFFFDRRTFFTLNLGF